MNITCPSCGASLEGDVEPGTPVECPSCGTGFAAAAESVVAAPAKPVPVAPPAAAKPAPAAKPRVLSGEPVPPRVVSAEPVPRTGSLVRGIVGAALGALAGALLWALVGLLGYISALVGFAIAWLVTFGYDHAGGVQGLPRVVVVFLAMVASVVLGNAFQVEWQLRDAWRQHRAKLDETVEMLFREAPDLAALEGEAREEALEGMRAGVEGVTYGEFRSEVLRDPDVRRDLLKNLGMGLIFAFLGGCGFLRKKDGEE